MYRLAREGGPRILDLGSGPAIVSSHLKRADGKHVTCIDSDADRLEVARTRGIDRTIRSDFETDGWADDLAGETFDVVILADVLEHLTDPARLLGLIRDRGLLSPSGFLVVSLPNVTHEAIVAELLTGRWRYREAGLLDATHLRFFTKESFIDLIEREGYVATRIHRTRLPLEHTEMSSLGKDLPSSVRDHLKELSEATTYQYVFRAEPAREARELAWLRSQNKSLEEETTRVAAAGEALKMQRSEAAARAKQNIQRLTKQNAELKAKIERVYASPTWKIGRAIVGFGRAVLHPRRTLGRRRGKRRGAAPAGKASVATGSLRPQPSTGPNETVVLGASPPEISVVIPAYKNLELTRKCVESIISSAGERTFEIVVVDNASGDGTDAWLRAESATRPDLIGVFNPTNLGFAGGVNSGVRRARGRTIVICNNDVVVTEGWLDRIAVRLDRHPEVGILSPLTNYVGEGPQLDPEAADVTPETANVYARRLASEDHPLRFVPDRLVFYCVAVRRELFDSLGGLSEDFGLGNFEDDDFCVRARMAGARLAVDPRVFVYHQGSATWAAANISHQEWMQRNRSIYFEKLAGYALGAGARARADEGAPQVSVVVRTQDRPALLREALTSLANQTSRRFEVVVVNDGGQDIGPVLDGFSDVLSIVRVTHDEPLGRVEALNAGLRAAGGEWITYLDDDDIVYPLHLELLLGVAVSSGHKVVYADANLSLWRVDGPRRGVLARRTLTPFPFERNELFVHNRIPIQSLMHAAGCIDEVGLFDTGLDLLEDWDFLLRLADRYPFVRVPRVTSEFRLRASDRFDNSILARHEELADATAHVYKRHPTESPELEEQRRRFLDDLRARVDEIRRLRESNPDEAQAALLVASRLAGFKVVEAQDDR